jgi:hypothetical protein
MRRKGNCWDNAVAENFFSGLKMELVHEADFATREQARTALFAYIEFFYNRKQRNASHYCIRVSRGERAVEGCALWPPLRWPRSALLMK